MLHFVRCLYCTSAAGSFESLKRGLITFAASYLPGFGSSAGLRGVLVGQPPNVGNPTQLKLMPHQLIGLSWMAMLHEKGIRACLNDEMGLGKTIQTIAFFGQLHRSGDIRPHLVVAPPSVLENWEREIKRWLPDARVIKYDGSNAKEEQDLFTPIDCDMSHGAFDKELQRHSKLVVVVSYTAFQHNTAANASASLFSKQNWSSCILDEAHLLKSTDSQRARSIIAVLDAAQSTFLLTGTDRSDMHMETILNFLHPSQTANLPSHKGKGGAAPATAAAAAAAAAGGGGSGGGRIRSVYYGSGDSTIERLAQRAAAAESTACNHDDASASVQLQRRIDFFVAATSPLFLRRLQSEVLSPMMLKWDKIEALKLDNGQRCIYEDVIHQHRDRELEAASAEAAAEVAAARAARAAARPVRAAARPARAAARPVRAAAQPAAAAAAAAAAARAGRGTDAPQQLQQQALPALGQRQQQLFTDLRKAANHPMLLRQYGFSDETVERIIDFALEEEVYGAQARRDQVSTEVKSLSGIALHVLCSEFPQLQHHAIARREICSGSTKLRRLRKMLPELQQVSE